jgi:predicted nucleic acid-binding protein
MTLRRGVIDASVLYAEPVRSLLLWVAADGGFTPFWTQRILDEAQSNLIEQSVVTAEQWDRLRDAMCEAFPDAMIDQAAVDALAPRMPNDKKDRHVLAAAVIGDADVVVTSNRRHFQRSDLEPLGKRALSPDELLCEVLAADPDSVLGAVRLQADVMRKPRQWTEGELLGLFAGLGRSDPPLPAFAAAAAQALRIRPVPPPDER